jgi:hypothetical protein
MWASNGRAVLSALFILVDVVCLCYCLLVVLSCSFLAAKTEDTLLFSSAQAAVFRMSELIRLIYRWFSMAIVSFVLSAALMIWMFVGLDQDDVADEAYACVAPGDEEGKARAGSNIRRHAP